MPGALDIDFRDTSFDSPCDGNASCSVDGVTLTASGGVLNWDSLDGFGVGSNGQINHWETLTIEFETTVTLTGVWLTDIFNPLFGPTEKAIIELSVGGGDVTQFTFFGEEFSLFGDFLGFNNGGEFGDFGGSVVADLVVFRSVNTFGNDFSVAGLAVVPLPGALGLMISGLVAFVVMARRRRKAAAA